MIKPHEKYIDAECDKLTTYMDELRTCKKEVKAVLLRTKIDHCIKRINKLQKQNELY